MTESTIISRCIKGDEAAYRSLYESYMPYMLTIIRRYGIDQMHERDALQNIFIEIFNSLKKYNADKGSFKSWARKIAVYNILNHKRNSGRLHVTHLEESHESKSTTTIDLADLDTAYIMKAVRALPDRYQNVFNLFCIDGYTHREISELLDISEVASRSHLHRAKAVLQKSITQLIGVV